MGSVDLDSIIVTNQRRIQSHGGHVLHAMKRSDESYKGFGEVYFSFVNPLAVKAWKKHQRMTLNLVVPVGTILFVFVDEEGNKLEEIIGVERYARLTVPPKVWFGFKGIGKSDNVLMNFADIPHDPNEVIAVSRESIQHDWG